MTKQELINLLEKKSVKVIKIIEEPDDEKNSANIKVYYANVMEQEGDGVVVKNVGFYTINEGTIQEKAFFKDSVRQKDNGGKLKNAVINYLKQIYPNPYVVIMEPSIDAEGEFARVSVIKSNGDGTGKEIEILVFKDKTNKINHLELIP